MKNRSKGYSNEKTGQPLLLRRRGKSTSSVRPDGLLLRWTEIESTQYTKASNQVPALCLLYEHRISIFILMLLIKEPCYYCGRKLGPWEAWNRMYRQQSHEVGQSFFTTSVLSVKRSYHSQSRTIVAAWKSTDWREPYMNDPVFLFFSGWGLLGLAVFSIAYAVSHSLAVKGLSRLELYCKVIGFIGLISFSSFRAGKPDSLPYR